VLSGPGTIGNAYSGTTPLAANQSFNPPSGTNVYTATTSDGNGCSAIKTVTVVVNPKPEPLVTADYCTYRPKVRLTTGTYSSYLWNTGATTQSIDVDVAGIFTVTVTSANGCTGTASIQVADELVVNGNFSSGNSGFTTGYTYTANVAGNVELYPEGYYGVGTSAVDYHNNFHGRDHTTGNGNFLIVNGSTSVPIKTIWQETVTVVPNTDYYFSAWAMNVNPGSPARLQFEVNGVLVGSVADLSTAPKPASEAAVALSNWVRFYSTPMWNSGATTTAIIRIRNLNTDPSGNDFGIDDISFGTLASVPFTFTASNNSPKCSRESVQLSSTVAGGVQPIVYTWTGPNGYISHDANPLISNISYNDRGTYSLSVVDAYNCPVTPVNTIVTLSPTPEIFNRTALICSGSSFNSTPVNGLPNASTFVPAGTTYSWSAPTIVPAGTVTGASAQTAQASISQALTNTTNLPATVTYDVIPVTGSCTGNSFTVTVTVNPSVTVVAGVDQQKCAGSSVQLNGSVSGAVTSGSWSGGTGAFAPNRNALNAVYTPSAAEITAGTITLTLNSVDPDGAGPCPAVSSSVTITINSLPVLSSTSVNVSCFGTSTGSVNLSVSGGTPAYSYAWTASGGGTIPPGSDNIQDISGLVAGTYNVVVTDTKTCGATLSVTLTQPPVLEAQESHTTVPCVIGATNVTIAATGGTAPYSGTGVFAQFAGTVTYTITDAKGCNATVNATVIADPNSAPVIITCPVTRNFNGCSTTTISGPVFSTTSAASTYTEFSNTNNKGVANDNCAITTVTYQDNANSACPVIVTRTWTLGDASGLTTTCQQIITVTDVVSPTWISAAGSLNRSVECSNAAGLAAAQALFPTASDVCDADVSDIVKTTGSFVQSAGCSQEGTYTNTWQVTDACGNISVAYTQVVTITDNTAPVWLTAAGTLNRTAECSDNAAIMAAQALYPVALDLCDANVSDVIKVAGSFVAGTCGNRGTYTNTWTVSDDCGNVSNVFTQVITITDNTAPVWLTAPGVLDRTLECSNTAGILSAQALVPLASDNCTAVPSNITKITGSFVPSSGCLNEGSYTNTWNVADACGNTSTIYTQVITIQDNVAPSIYCPASDAYSCDSPSFEPTVTGTATVIDNCDVNPLVSWSDVIVDGACAGNYQISRTWATTDACGNTNTCVQTIFVQDVAAPVISCAVSGNQNVYPNPAADFIAPDNAWDATATDNCSGVTLSAMLSGATATGPHSSLSGVAFSEGLTIVTWTATDGCGISSTCQFSVTVTFKPEISCPAAITLNNDTDACSSYIDPGFPTWIVGTAPVIYTWIMTGATAGSGTGPIGNYTFNSGITTIAWTATNFAGTGICEQTITVNDNQAPAFKVPADKYYCVRDISVANFDDPTIDITPVRPDYYLFLSGNTDLDLEPAEFSDNCPITCAFEIRWRIDFEDGTFLPALPATYITGQPSAYGNDILLPGKANSSVPHFIKYQVVDCNGNVSAPQNIKITIDPRPDVIKIY